MVCHAWLRPDPSHQWCVLFAPTRPLILPCDDVVTVTPVPVTITNRVIVVTPVFTDRRYCLFVTYRHYSCSTTDLFRRVKPDDGALRWNVVLFVRIVRWAFATRVVFTNDP